MPAIGLHTITKGDTLEPLNAVLRYKNGNPINLAAFTMKARMETDSGTEEIAKTATGVTAHPTQTFTLDSTNNWITCNAHGYEVGDVWIPSTSGSLSGTGLTAAVRYKIIETDVDWFKVSVRNGGAAVTIAGAGTGTHTGYVVGSIQYVFLAANVDTAGTYRFWFARESGSDQWTHPEGDRHIEVRIVEAGN
jgi:hypothetical protein